MGGGKKFEWEMTMMIGEGLDIWDASSKFKRTSRREARLSIKNLESEHAFHVALGWSDYKGLVAYQI
ncbi:hypothetical protein WAI453_004590 [Rhynchosporium graminicola]